jgi:hypothetical protein
MRKPPPLPIALVLAVALVAATPAAPAAARIIVNRGVEPVRIGMSERQVRAKLGTADVREHSGATTSLVYRRRALVVTLLRGHVTIVSTRSRRERTSRGVGPGTALRSLRRRVAGEHCGAKVGVYLCKVGSSRKGRRSTVFLVVDGRVDTVSVALAP